MLDVVIRGGSVVDGTGRARRVADVGIRDGKIVEIGHVTESARRSVDADGLVVAPGFIDVHTHLDAQAFWDPTLSPSSGHGVTTVIGGNCGFSIAPLPADSADYLMKLLSRVEAIPLRALEAGVPWNWRTTGEYLDRLEGTLAVNAGFMVGHSAVRRAVMGEAGSERAATVDEIAAMRREVRDSLDAGALGFSSSWSRHHNDAAGDPVPSRMATAQELIELSEVCREVPGTSLEFIPFAQMPFDDETRELMTAMSVRAQRPLNWNVMLPSAANVEQCFESLAAGSHAAERGGKVLALTLPIRIPMRFCFANGFTLDALPGWEQAMALPDTEKLQLLRDPEQRRRLDELSQAPGPLRDFAADWPTRVILEAFTAETKRFEGRLVGDIAAEHGTDPFDALLDIVCADGLRTLFGAAQVPETADDWKARLAIWRDSRALVGGSDAGAHVELFGTFNYVTLMLQEAVRKWQVLGLEEAVHLVTQVPADLYGLAGRGRIETGYAADLVVLDEATVGSQPLSSRNDLPSGASRLYAEATGINHVLVNGAEILRDGRFSDQRPGSILRSGARHA